jgi:hypothetical protein
LNNIYYKYKHIQVEAVKEHYIGQPDLQKESEQQQQDYESSRPNSKEQGELEVAKSNPCYQLIDIIHKVKYLQHVPVEQVEQPYLQEGDLK